FQFLRGHVQICFYTWIAIAFYAVTVLAMAARRPEELPRLAIRSAALLGAAALAFGIARVYNLPRKDYAGQSMPGAPANRRRRAVRVRHVVEHGLLRAAVHRLPELGRLRRRHVLGRDAVHGLPERVPRRDRGAAGTRRLRGGRRRTGHGAHLRRRARAVLAA